LKRREELPTRSESKNSRLEERDMRREKLPDSLKKRDLLGKQKKMEKRRQID